jgi:hypothetical protein
MSKAKMKPIKIAAEFQWANTAKVNDMSGKYQIDCCNLSAEAKKAVEEAGGTVRSREDKPEKGFFITAKSNYEIPVVDTSGNEIKDPIGNGSKGHIVIQPYPWSFRGKSGVGLGAAKVVVTTLVHYEDGSEEVDGDDEVL